MLMLRLLPFILGRTVANQRGPDDWRGADCPYLHPSACDAPQMKHFLVLWAQKVKCWLCNTNEEIVGIAHGIIADLVRLNPTITADRTFTGEWLERCMSGYLLAMFMTTKGSVVQSWRYYELGLNIIRTCNFDDGIFFDLFDITPSQISYVFFLLTYSHKLPKRLFPPLQSSDFVKALGDGQGSVSLSSAWEAPLVIDVGMGLGADTRYYLFQGFRVVAIEANSRSIQTALADRWTKPFLESGQLSIVNAAISSASASGMPTAFFSLPERPEQSSGMSWTMEAGAEKSSVRSIACADIVHLYGRAQYMKIDVESNTLDCLESLFRTHMEGGRRLALPKLLSLEVEGLHVAEAFYGWLVAMGYYSYKVCRQYVYTPMPCELGSYSDEIPGCGSGLFGDAAVDYIRGPVWHDISHLRNDTAWG
eukprot:gnl/TRDRNA2_/TRDRNA2_173639_c0_seq1.p1 gnl/TRDRNA2_/TRDRNA2_173639_c0~~gnl/TRDRNA2_/TRDRNA2_173639_c0_seq1.p1  ORF type:complete len:421 (+),score=44.85 gnl/TRDRNA2_/TRDRNA2_173639_c0_seq1:101-1363(+)